MIRKLAILLSFLLVAGASGSPWYLRTYHFKGNPVHPLTLVWRGEVIAQGIPDAVYRSDRFPGHHIPPEIKGKLDANKWGTVLESWTLDPWEHIAESGKMGGMGAVLSVLCVPALVGALAFGVLRRRWDVVVFVVCWGVSYALFPFPTWARFAMPAIIPVLVALAVTMEECDGCTKKAI